MTLQIHTARIGCPDPDRLDITRKSGSTLGLAFAPTWAILSPALAARREAKELRAQGRVELADGVESRAWRDYVIAFTTEMGVGLHRTRRGAWRALLQRERVVLLCYCGDPRFCHRTLVGRMLAGEDPAFVDGGFAEGIAKLGVEAGVFAGELPTEQRRAVR